MTNKLILAMVTNFIFVCSFAHTCHDSTRNSTKREFYISYLAGYSDSQMHGSFVQLYTSYLGNNDTEVVNKKGVVIGATLETDIYKFVYARTGLLFLQKGGEIRNTNATYDDPDFQISYLTLPLRVSVKPISNKKFSFTLDGGIDLNFKIVAEYAKLLTEFGKVNSFTYSGCFGGSVLYQLSNRVCLQGIYQRFIDLAPFYDDKSDDGSYAYEAKAKGNIFAVGVRLRTHK